MITDTLRGSEHGHAAQEGGSGERQSVKCHSVLPEVPPALCPSSGEEMGPHSDRCGPILTNPIAGYGCCLQPQQTPRDAHSRIQTGRRVEVGRSPRFFVYSFVAALAA